MRRLAIIIRLLSVFTLFLSVAATPAICLDIASADPIPQMTGHQVATGQAQIQNNDVSQLDGRSLDRSHQVPGPKDALFRGLVGQSSKDSSKKLSEADKIWRSEELSLLAVGLGVGDIDGDGKNDIVVSDLCFLLLL